MNRETFQIRWLGRMDYQEALGVQETVVRERAENHAPDTLLLLEHPPTITLGRCGTEVNLLVPRPLLEKEGVAVCRTDRGGDVTYHGPGQLVGYPVFNLRHRPGRIGRYLRDLEQALILALAQYGVIGSTLPGLTGVWVGNEKVAAIGIKVNARGISSHGFALNVTTDLTYFDKIVPCGIRGKGVTSLQRLLGRSVSLNDAAWKVAEAFSQVFAAHAMAGTPEPLDS